MGSFFLLRCAQVWIYSSSHSDTDNSNIAQLLVGMAYRTTYQPFYSLIYQAIYQVIYQPAYQAIYLFLMLPNDR